MCQFDKRMIQLFNELIIWFNDSKLWIKQLMILETQWFDESIIWQFNESMIKWFNGSVI